MIESRKQKESCAAADEVAVAVCEAIEGANDVKSTQPQRSRSRAGWPA